MTDVEKLNPGIVRTVRLLNRFGYKTCDSGDGETRDYACDRDRGYVVVRLDPGQDLEESGDAIAQLLVPALVPAAGAKTDDPRDASQDKDQ